MANISELAKEHQHATRAAGAPADESDMRRVALLPLVASVLFSLGFILRTAFTVSSEWYLSLSDDAMVSMR